MSVSTVEFVGASGDSLKMRLALLKLLMLKILFLLAVASICQVS